MADDGQSAGAPGEREWHPSVRICRIKIHRNLYNAYVALYHEAQIMTRKMDEVLDHRAHLDLIDDGKMAGYKMPDVESVRARNEIIKTYLRNTDPYRDVSYNGDMVEFPAGTARRLFLVAEYSSRQVYGVVDQINASDYMLWIRTMRMAGAPYDGPISLQEVFNVWGCLIAGAAMHAAHAPAASARLPANWLKLTV